MRIYKYSLESSEPVIATGLVSICDVQTQGGVYTLWAQVDPKNKQQSQIEMTIVGTGWEYNDIGNYIKTFQDGPFVWHIFVKVTPK